jgi:hypothetical protein
MTQNISQSKVYFIEWIEVSGKQKGISTYTSDRLYNAVRGFQEEKPQYTIKKILDENNNLIYIGDGF